MDERIQKSARLGGCFWMAPIQLHRHLMIHAILSSANYPGPHPLGRPYHYSSASDLMGFLIRLQYPIVGDK